MSDKETTFVNYQHSQVASNTYDTFNKWSYIFVGFLIYSISFISGYFSKLQEMNYVGIIFLVVFIILAWLNKLSIRKDVTVYLACLLIIFPFLSAPFIKYELSFIYVIKYTTIFILYIFAFSLKLSPLNQSKIRYYFLITILAILIISLVSGRMCVAHGETRLSGLFANPNNLSLISFALLFFINEETNELWLNRIILITIILILLFSATTGAFFAFAMALTYKYKSFLLQKKYLSIILLLIILLVVANYFINLRSFQFIDKIFLQFTLIYEKSSQLGSSGNIDYGELASTYSQKSLSGLWRLVMWRHVLDLFWNGSIIAKLFGNGIGASTQLLSILPHNDYLRTLLEQGICGLISIISFFTIIFHRTAKKDRYIIIAFAVYSFSENNIDNNLFMSLLMLFLASIQNIEHKEPEII